MPDAYARALLAAAREPDAVELGRTQHYADAVLYDYEYRRRRADVRFYRTIADEALGGCGRVLELACGSGRVTVALLRAGHEVLGVDMSPQMLARASGRVGRLGRAARARCALVRADMRRFAVGERFGLIAMAFNSFEHLYTRADVEACLACVREHLAPGGLFVFDVQNPDLRWLGRDPERRWARTRFRHPTTGAPMVYSTNHEYDPIRQIVVIRLYYAHAEAERAGSRGGRREPARPDRRARGEAVVVLSQRKFFPAELETTLAAEGFGVVARYGGFQGEPLEAASESQVLVCRAERR